MSATVLEKALWLTRRSGERCSYVQLKLLWQNLWVFLILSDRESASACLNVYAPSSDVLLGTANTPVAPTLGPGEGYVKTESIISLSFSRSPFFGEGPWKRKRQFLYPTPLPPLQRTADCKPI